MFWAENGPGNSQEVFKKLPGGRGFVLTEYEPVARHGDPIHDDVIDVGNMSDLQKSS